jgi:probable phosphoglycerate mutase
LKKRVILFRHGQTDWNKAHRWQGHVDIPLNDDGIRQAVELARRAKDWALQQILSSDLTRALVTAKHVGEELPLVTCSSLREGHFGEAEGKTKDEILETYGKDFLRRWNSLEEKHMDLCFPNGESRRQMHDRFVGGLKKHLAESKFEIIGVSTHGGVIRQFLRTIVPSITLPSPIPNCSAFELQYNVEEESFMLIGALHPEELISQKLI